MDKTARTPKSWADDYKVMAMARLPFFAGCTRREVVLAARLVDAAILPAGATLQRQGSRARWLSVLADGTVSAIVDDRPTQLLESGACWGIEAIFEGQPGRMSVEALSVVMVLQMNRRVFATLERLLPTVATRLRREGMRVVRPVDEGPTTSRVLSKGRVA